MEEFGGSLNVPWKSFFQSKAVWAMIYAHFCGSWGHYCCLSWLPTYFSEELDRNLTEATCLIRVRGTLFRTRDIGSYFWRMSLTRHGYVDAIPYLMLVNYQLKLV